MKRCDSVRAVVIAKRAAEKKQDEDRKAVALIWQGHMLDLMGKRREAVALYKKVVEMNITSTWTHSQYGLEYTYPHYARERMKTPFVRVENKEKD